MRVPGSDGGAERRVQLPQADFDVMSLVTYEASDGRSREVLLEVQLRMRVDGV